MIGGSGTVNVISSVVVGNSSVYVPAANDIGVHGKCIIDGSTVGYIGMGASSGIVEIKKNNTIEKLVGYTSDAIGTVIISSGASINLTSSINPGGTGGITVLTGGCTVNGNAIPAGTYTSINSNGQAT